jgi:uncharacterized membrane protein (UPF0127 family)
MFVRRSDPLCLRLWMLLPVLRAVALGSLAATTCGCEAAETTQPSTLPTVEMGIGSKTYTIEVAATPDQQKHGLMERDSMPANHGMIFVFPVANEQSFWMKNTRFPLDIIYIAEDSTVVSIKQMKAYDRTGVPSDGAAMYAIELNLGQAAQSGLKAGAKVTIPEKIKPAPATKVATP